MVLDEFPRFIASFLTWFASGGRTVMLQIEMFVLAEGVLASAMLDRAVR